MDIASMHSWVVEFCCKREQEQGATAGRGEWWLGKDRKMGDGICVCTREHVGACWL